MTEQNQKQLGNTLWSIADQLRGAMDADNFRDYMLSFLFLRYLSDNYETAAKKELGRDYPVVDEEAHEVPLAVWYANNEGMCPISRSRCAARCTTSSSPRSAKLVAPKPSARRWPIGANSARAPTTPAKAYSSARWSAWSIPTTSSNSSFSARMGQHEVGQRRSARSGHQQRSRAMLGKCEGDEVSIPVAPIRQRFEVLRVH